MWFEFYLCRERNVSVLVPLYLMVICCCFLNGFVIVQWSCINYFATSM